MRYVAITLSFLALYILTSLTFTLALDNPNWINGYSEILGLGLLVCLILNIIGTLKGFRNYRKPTTTQKDRVGAWLNLSLVSLFVGGLLVPNILDLYRAFN